jgi:hypothetical protein
MVLGHPNTILLGDIYWKTVRDTLSAICASPTFRDPFGDSLSSHKKKKISHPLFSHVAP